MLGYSRVIWFPFENRLQQLKKLELGAFSSMIDFSLRICCSTNFYKNVS